ncbi:MAG: DUF6443 domain-containing protein [Bacteroidota bacterium]
MTLSLPARGDRSPFTVTVNHPPAVNAGADQVFTLPVGDPIIFNGSATDPDGTVSYYLWRQVSGPDLALGGTVSANLSVTDPPGGIYSFRLTATDNNNMEGSDDVMLTINYPAEGQNFVRTESVVIKNVTAPFAIDGLTSDEKNTSTTFFDGIGRPAQTVSWQASPLKKDIVQPVAYDAFGRQPNNYLPFASGEATGNYKSSSVAVDGNYSGSLQDSFYDNGAFDKVQDDERPFSETLYEPSPLNRPVKEIGPG